MSDKCDYVQYLKRNLNALHSLKALAWQIVIQQNILESLLLSILNGSNK